MSEISIKPKTIYSQTCI